MTNNGKKTETDGQSQNQNKGVIIVDDCGSNDYFGPLVIVSLYASPEALQWFKTCNLDMSQPLDVNKKYELIHEVQNRCAFHPVIITPIKYNGLFYDMPHVKEISAWGYATAIESLLDQVECQHVICNGFEKNDMILHKYLNMSGRVPQIQIRSHGIRSERGRTRRREQRGRKRLPRH